MADGIISNTGPFSAFNAGDDIAGIDLSSFVGPLQDPAQTVVAQSVADDGVNYSPVPGDLFGDTFEPLEADLSDDTLRLIEFMENEFGADVSFDGEDFRIQTAGDDSTIVSPDAV